MATGSRDFRANPLAKLGGLKQLRVGKDVGKEGKPEDILMDVNTLEDLIEGIKKVGGSDDIINFAQSLFHGAANFKATQPFFRRTQYDQSGRFRYLEKSKQTVMSGKSNIPKIMLNALINTLNNPIVEEVGEEEVERPDYTRIQEIQRRASNYVEQIRFNRKEGLGGSFEQGTLQAYGSGESFLDVQERNQASYAIIRDKYLAAEKRQEEIKKLRGEANVRRLEEQRESSGGIGKFSDTLQDIAYKEAMTELIAPKEARLRRLTEQFGTRKRAEKYVAEEAKREQKLEQEHNKQLAQNNKLLGGMLKMHSVVRGPFGSQMILGPYGTLAWNALKGLKKLAFDLPIEAAGTAMQVRTASESVGVSPMEAMKFGFATRAFGGNAGTSAGTLGGIAMIRQGALVGGGLGGLGEAALRYGLNISGSGEGGLATTNEILIRSAAIMQNMKDETKAAFARTLGIDKATFQLLKKGSEETAREIKKAESQSPYTEDYYSAMEEVSQAMSRTSRAWDSIVTKVVTKTSPIATSVFDFLADELESFDPKNAPAVSTLNKKETIRRLKNDPSFEAVRHARELGASEEEIAEAYKHGIERSSSRFAPKLTHINKDVLRVMEFRENLKENQISTVIDDLSIGPEMNELLPGIEAWGGYINKVYDESTKNWTYEIHVDGAKDPEATAREIERIIQEQRQEQLSDLAIGGVGR